MTGVIRSSPLKHCLFVYITNVYITNVYITNVAVCGITCGGVYEPSIHDRCDTEFTAEALLICVHY
jgi:hypothetical protein